MQCEAQYTLCITVSAVTHGCMIHGIVLWFGLVPLNADQTRAELQHTIQKYSILYRKLYTIQKYSILYRNTILYYTIQIYSLTAAPAVLCLCYSPQFRNNVKGTVPHNNFIPKSSHNGPIDL